MIYLKSLISIKLCRALALFLVLGLLSGCSKNQKDAPDEPVNLAPEVMAQAFSTQTEEEIRDKLAAQDPEHQTLRFTLVQPPVLGQVTLAKDGSFSYSPNEETTGNDSFIFSVSDGVNPEVTAKASITITALMVDFSRFSRDAFAQQANDVPVKLNGRIFTDDIDSSDFYADLFVF
ncbi:Ig-like domain-containing protein [Thalassomonas actiniarum]|uniref:Ig-like domain-containing protein n=1 Tax=Thalassomonas actiniarum TaxID=485447 RepID=A0AAE9YUS1_9GAMM|nr:Ig-like domain-containing protein [Thalassomonas actiniarum]WDE01615.1 Ig-like domain-containing protein [Thalassomonas actiniarum]